MNENSVRNIRVSLPYIPTKATTAMPDRSAGLCCQNREFAKQHREATPRSNTAKPHCTVKTANSTAKPQPRPRSRLHCQNHDLATAKPELQSQAAKPDRTATAANSNRTARPQSQAVLPEPRLCNRNGLRSQTALSETQSRSRKRPDPRSQTVEPEPQSHGPFFTRHLDPSSFDHVPLLLIRFMKTG